MPGVTFCVGDLVLLDEIRPLWQKLNDHHRKNSRHFKERYTFFTFDKRKADLLEKVRRGWEMRIWLARNTTGKSWVGYCICTANRADSTGEIESIFVEEAYQKNGLGKLMMGECLKWMEENELQKKVATVAAGNEDAFPFYAKFGFFPYLTILLKNDTA